jgi:membrane-bound serine protease (ClpP class)
MNILFVAFIIIKSSLLLSTITNMNLPGASMLKSWVSFFFIVSMVLSIRADEFGNKKYDFDKPSVVIIPVSGTVDQGMAAFISRALTHSEKYKNRIIVLEIDTYGGAVDAAFKIVDTMVNVKNTKTLAYVKSKAISAGALIALSCQQLVMQNSTTIGAVAPLTYDQDGPKMLGEKFQSPIRAKFRTLAKKNGYPEKLTEAMVTEGISVYEVKFKDSTVVYIDSTELADLSAQKKAAIVSKKMVDKAAELLTLDDVEAKRYGFSKMSVSNIDEMVEKLGYSKYQIVRLEQSWSEWFVRLIGTIAPILLMIGLGALYIEIKTPGIGFPGIIGIICLALVFFGQYMVGLADHTELLLMVIGILLILLEMFVFPGFGVAGIAGILFLIVGLILSFQGFVIPKPEFPWQMKTLQHNLLMVMGSILGSFILAAAFFKFVFPKISLVVKGPLLNADLHDAKADMDTLIKIYPGSKGVAMSILRPAGKAQFDNDMYDVVTDGEFIDKGSLIIVTTIQGNRIVVSMAKEEERAE